MIVNYITIDKITDLYQIFEVPIYLAGNDSQLYEEIYANSWGITIENEFAKKVKADDLAEFISDLVKSRTEEILMIKPSIKATLYFWFDEMSLQLCFNILSNEDRELPFGCRINIVDSPYPVLKRFIKVAYNNAFYGNYLGVTEIIENENGFADDEDDGEMDLDKILIDVWRITLPWDGEAE